MTNNQLARYFTRLAKIMEFHGENVFKIKAYNVVADVLKKSDDDFSIMSRDELEKIPGVGKAIADKITEIYQTGTLKTLEKYLALYPPGIEELLSIKGLGPKKVRQLWEELGVSSPGELIYACEENRLTGLKGFGARTQEDIKQKATFFTSSKGLFLMPSVLDAADRLTALLPKNGKTIIVGDLARRLPVVKGIELLTTIKQEEFESLAVLSGEDNTEFDGIPVFMYFCSDPVFNEEQLRLTSSESFYRMALRCQEEGEKTVDEILRDFAPYRRENSELIQFKGPLYPQVAVEDIKGVIHVHTSYSDGSQSLEDMAMYCRNQGYHYLVVTDHSQSAVYANGLSPERLKEQWAEIDHLNTIMATFTIFRGIESDILADGSLDYNTEVLSGFECVIASVHSGLKMDDGRATERLIKAIENPYTRILGHPTGRLLLSRAGYTPDMHKILDACAANNVAIEINSNPWRMDLDWKWYEKACEKGIYLSINPDAHSLAGVSDIQWGVWVAGKTNINPDFILNKMPVDEFKNWLQRK
jgi:DNA polymerase (family 10)